MKKDNNKNIWYSTPISTFDAPSKWHESDKKEIGYGQLFLDEELQNQENNNKVNNKTNSTIALL